MKLGVCVYVEVAASGFGLQGRALSPFLKFTIPPFIIPLSLSIPPDGLVIQPLKRVYLAQK